MFPSAHSLMTFIRVLLIYMSHTSRKKQVGEKPDIKIYLINRLTSSLIIDILLTFLRKTPFSKNRTKYFIIRYRYV